MASHHPTSVNSGFPSSDLCVIHPTPGFYDRRPYELKPRSSDQRFSFKFLIMPSYSKITTPKKLTDFKYVNLYSTEVQTSRGTSPWTFASRKADPGATSAAADAAVIIAVVLGSDEPRLVLTREFRAPLGTYEISVPSGLIDPGESAAEAAAREMREETGLELVRVVHVSPPVASSAGLTDETVALVYAEAAGTISKAHQTEHEEIETRLVTLAEIRDLLGGRTKDIISSRLYPVLVDYVSAGAISLPQGLGQAVK